jgi:hypothetical protein
MDQWMRFVALGYMCMYVKRSLKFENKWEFMVLKDFAWVSLRMCCTLSHPSVHLAHQGVTHHCTCRCMRGQHGSAASGRVVLLQSACLQSGLCNYCFFSTALWSPYPITLIFYRPESNQWPDMLGCLLHLQDCCIWCTCNSLFLQHVLELCCESLGNAHLSAGVEGSPGHTWPEWSGNSSMSRPVSHVLCEAVWCFSFLIHAVLLTKTVLTRSVAKFLCKQNSHACLSNCGTPHHEAMLVS